MQRDDGGHDRQTKAVAGQTSAPVETVEALDEPGALGQRDTWAAVLNDQGHGVFFGCPHVHRRPAAGIFQGIIDQIHDRVRQEVLFAERHRLKGLENEVLILTDLPSLEPMTPWVRSIFYVGMTRAKSKLFAPLH